MIAHVETPEEFKELIEVHPAVVADFWATWCGPCVTMGKTLESVDEELGEGLTIAKIDVDNTDVKTIAEDFPFVSKIRSIPTLAFFKNGALVDVDLDEEDEDAYGDRGIFVGAVSRSVFMGLLAKAGLN